MKEQNIEDTAKQFIIDAKTLVRYCWHDELKHWQELSYPTQHIFHTIQRMATTLRIEGCCKRGIHPGRR